MKQDRFLDQGILIISRLLMIVMLATRITTDVSMVVLIKIAIHKNTVIVWKAVIMTLLIALGNQVTAGLNLGLLIL